MANNDPLTKRMSLPRQLIMWLTAHMRLQYLFIPIATRNIVYTHRGLVGYRDYYVCGIRVARMQQTRPWVDGG